MTKDKAIGEIYNYSEQCVDIAWVHSMINKIYDDFDKQTCSNCKWYSEPICSASKCEDINELGQYVASPTFGCNEWEGKIND